MKATDTTTIFESIVSQIHGPKLVVTEAKPMKRTWDGRLASLADQDVDDTLSVISLLHLLITRWLPVFEYVPLFLRIRNLLNSTIVELHLVIS
jgi:hypothetical protein